MPLVATVSGRALIGCVFGLPLVQDWIVDHAKRPLGMNDVPAAVGIGVMLLIGRHVGKRSPQYEPAWPARRFALTSAMFYSLATTGLADDQLFGRELAPIMAGRVIAFSMHFDRRDRLADSSVIHASL